MLNRRAHFESGLLLTASVDADRTIHAALHRPGYYLALGTGRVNAGGRNKSPVASCVAESAKWAPQARRRLNMAEC